MPKVAIGGLVARRMEGEKRVMVEDPSRRELKRGRVVQHFRRGNCSIGCS